ncbi:MAG: helix-turn-helix transcriptional regulator [Candidatus Eremiobacteraeota bacterium]|nr:helix-turn-helix transcriptional regulator [Candidatus Eremiobacteraeota bacterium]MBV9971775.1 helix-turn-helix transcriptional regulator [Candidatus Eremiobacteraeota bacterium]
MKRQAGELTAREVEVARGVVHCGSNKHVAAALNISEKTVEKHLSKIFRKLGFTSRAQLAVYMVTEGEVPAPAY